MIDEEDLEHQYVVYPHSAADKESAPSIVENIVEEEVKKPESIEGTDEREQSLTVHEDELNEDTDRGECRFSRCKNEKAFERRQQR